MQVKANAVDVFLLTLSHTLLCQEEREDYPDDNGGKI